MDKGMKMFARITQKVSGGSERYFGVRVEIFGSPTILGEKNKINFS